MAATLLAIGVNTTVKWMRNKVDPPPPPLATQLESVIRTKAESGSELVYSSRMDMRGTGTISRVMVFRPFYGPTRPNVDVSDELRIYDVRDKRLRLAFAFEPVHRFRNSKARFPLPAGVDLLASGDVNGDGRSEIVVSFTEHYADTVNAHPVLIRWDHATSRFTVTALLTRSDHISGRFPNRPAGLVKAARDREDHASGYQTLYLTPVAIQDRLSRQPPFRTVGGETFIVTSGSQAKLVGAFVTKSPGCFQCVTQIQLLAWSFDVVSPDASVDQCFNLPHKPILIPVPGHGDFTPVLERRWSALGKRC